MDEFPSNSKRFKKEVIEESPGREKKLVKVVSGEVVRRKKPLWKSFRAMIVGDDDTSIGEFLLLEVVVPNIKDLLYDVGTLGLERKLYGEGYGGPRRSRNRHSSRGPVPYDRISSRRDERPPLSRQARMRHEFEEIVIDSRTEAIEVLDAMYELLEKYEQVTVGNFLELVGEPSEYTDERHGWSDLQGTVVRKVRGGYILDLPRTEVLER